MRDIKEGDLYKVIEAGGRTFEIRYGYYDPALERGRTDLMPIFPNFIKDPLHTTDGCPFVTADQEVCEHFLPKSSVSGEGWCNDCEYLEHCEEFLGICRSPERRKRKNE